MPRDKVEGYLEIGTNGKGQVIMNHPKPMTLSKDGSGHFLFSATQARHLARSLMTKADEADREVGRITIDGMPVN